MSFVVDYSLARPGGGALKAAGAGGVMRYTGAYRNDGAIITRGEWEDLTGHGLAVGLVLEYAADWMLAGYTHGHDMATAARQLEDSLGIPRGVTYGAVDMDITLGGPPVSGQALGNCARALDAFHGMADAYGGWEYVRPYGSKWFCEWAADHSPMKASWSTQAWSFWNGRYQPAAGAVLYQHASWPAGAPQLGGCDYNDILGDWAPRTAAAPQPSGELTMDAEAKTAFAALTKVVTDNSQQLATIIEGVPAGKPNPYGLVGLRDIAKRLDAIDAALAKR